MANFFLYILVIITGLLIQLTLSENDGNSTKILSRRRRYLIFPSGSSLQLVYCGIFPVVDYTNLFILGLTTALAWELPDQPTYVDDTLMEGYENGTLPLLDRNDNGELSDANLIDTKPPINNFINEIKHFNDLDHKYDSYYNRPKYPDNYYSKQNDNYYKNQRFGSEDAGILNEINQYSSKPYAPWSKTSWTKNPK